MVVRVVLEVGIMAMIITMLIMYCTCFFVVAQDVDFERNY